MIFHPNYPLEGLRGADYNPRQIGEAELARLRHSLDRLGVCKPIIVAGQTIVAGHQRTRSLRALGRTHAPAIVLSDITATDEIRFNQLHNGTDFDAGDENANVGPAACEPFNFEDVPYRAINGNMRGQLATAPRRNMPAGRALRQLGSGDRDDVRHGRPRRAIRSGVPRDGPGMPGLPSAGRDRGRSERAYERGLCQTTTLSSVAIIRLRSPVPALGYNPLGMASGSIRRSQRSTKSAAAPNSTRCRHT